MEFPRLDSAITTCRRHLQETNSFNTEIEAIVVGYLLAVTYAEYEQTVRRLISERGRTDDERLTAFVRVATERIVRSLRLSELKGFLGFFHEDCKQALHDEVNDTRAHLAYDSIINSRQDLTHRFVASMTLAEFEDFYRESVVVLEAMERALHLQ